ncbi:charged multivesicular body protein 7 [Biomphalaria pfeifferi]|uniref:Charged multivesicular body protein 7 n=1 Tax=Biomphalaria pfeifferi TaxID=112525 RepID=A0AAD8B1K7_BIOPF|nr:charged multivesicular body protein 7 [Biomphalaria pfeifferi]
MAQKENKFPPELEDDQQAAVLYSPFREKSLNPTSWNRKLKFWENLLSGMALEQGLVTFDLDALPKMFERKGLTPKCLDTVIAELIKSGRVRSIENYSTSSSWLSWGFETLIKQPVVWGVSHLVGPSKPKSSIYVWPEVVKNLAEQLAQQHEKNVYAGLTTNLISMNDLRTSCFSMIPNDQDFEIILVQLEREKKIVVETKNKEKVVKFYKKEENSVEPITELELQVYQIQKTAKGLEKEISKCSTEIESLIDEAKRYVREGSKFKAKKSLKKKNGMLKLMEKKSSTLENLYAILEKIQDASTNEMVVKACESGLAALKSINAETNLEKAEAVLDNLQEAVENQDDIAHTLASLNLGEDSMEDLESELLELMKDDNQVVQHDSGKISSLDDLPDVPSHVPSRKKESTQSKHLPHKYLSSS